MRRSLAIALLPLGLLAACAPAGNAVPPAASFNSKAAHRASPDSANKATPTPPHAGERATLLNPEASPITYDLLARYPEPGMTLPRGIAYSPDGKLVTYLQHEEQTGQLSLFALDVGSKESRVLLRAGDLIQDKNAKPMSREEELRRERQRMKAQGITSYRWAKRAPVMLIPYGGDIFLRSEKGSVTRLTDTPAPEIDPQVCATGDRVVFVRGGELFMIDAASRRETQLTKGAPEGVTRGLSDFNGQEEFGEFSGFWIAPGCDKIAYLEVDERALKTVPVLGYRGGKPDLMMQKYPFAGGKNASVRVGVMDLSTRKTTWLTWPNDAERYFGRFVWSHDGKALYLQTLSRDQKRLALVRANSRSGETAELAVETSPTWVEFADMELLERSPSFVWSHAVAGHMHIDLRDAETGKVIAPLTSGDWDVEAIAAVDETRGRVIVNATKESPLERHWYSVSLPSSDKAAGGEMTRLTTEPGWHMGRVEREGRGFVDLHSARDRMWKAVVRGAGGEAITALPIPASPELSGLRLRVPEVIHFQGPSGDTIYGSLLKPRTLEPGKRYPVVVMIYGGGGQTVVNRWSPWLLWNHLADRNMVVLQVDNRGTEGRGLAFRAPFYGGREDVVLEDHVAALDFLRSMPFVDTSRVGIHGHSYGGTMTVDALLKAPDRFHVGVAGAPLTDWGIYDSACAERFMNLPEKNPEGYKERDLSRFASNLRGKLLLIHSLMDENVHFESTARLIDAFVAADKPFDLLVLPGERHWYADPTTRRYVMRRIVDYLTEHL